MRIFTLCKPYLLSSKYALAIYISLTFTTVIIAIISPYILGDFIDNLIQGADVNTILRFCFIFGGLSLLGIVKGYATSLLYIKMQNKMGYGLNKAVLQHIQRVSLSYCNNKDIAYISNRVNTDANSLIGFCINVLQRILTNAIKLVVPFIILLTLNRFITTLMLIFLVVYLLLYFACRKLLYEAGLALRESQARFFSGLLEQLKHIKLIKTNAIQKEINQRADGKFTALDRAALHNQKVNYLYTGMDGIISTIAQIVLFVIGGLQILSGNFTIGMFTIFTAYFNLMLGAARYFYGLGAAYQHAVVAYDRIQEILGQEPETYGIAVPDDISSIALHGVGFAYGGEDAKRVVDNFSSTFTKGNMYAVVGANGAGKSTLISLMMGLYINEFSGEIAYNHTGIRDIDMTAARRNHIGYAAQEPELVNDSILYNLTYDNNHERVNDAHLKDCIQTLGMAEFFRKHGLDFKINETNSNISGGEKQKIAILAVLYKNPSVMIFDEPTSALDAGTTARFINYLHRVKKEKIIVVITHDAQVQACCDKVVALSSLRGAKRRSNPAQT